MPRGVITATVPTSSGTVLIAPTTGDATNNHQVANSGRTRVHVKNSGATVARTVTFLVYQTVDGNMVTSKTQALPVGQTWVFGPFDVNIYGTLLLINVDNAELLIHAVE